MNAIATVQLYQCRFDDGRATSEAILQLAPGLGDVGNWCPALNNMATSLMDQGQFCAAIPLYERAIVLAQHHHVLQQLMYLHGNLGITYL